MRGPLLALLLLLPPAAAAHPHNAGECREGGDFIRNAALSRDAGYSREFLLGRLEADLLIIRAFAPELRWFVRDEDDEQFLRTELQAVFDAPQSSERHRADFLQRCIRRSEDLTAAARG